MTGWDFPKNHDNDGISNSTHFFSPLALLLVVYLHGSDEGLSARLQNVRVNRKWKTGGRKYVQGFQEACQ